MAETSILIVSQLFSLMQKLNFQIIVCYLLIFSSPTLVDVLFGGLATAIELGLLMGLWVYTLVVIQPKLKARERKIPDIFLLLITAGSLAMLGVSWLVREIPLTVIIYRLFPCFSFFPFVYLLLYLRRRYSLFKKLLITIILLCNLIAVGVIIDSQGLLIEAPVVGEKIVQLEQDSASANFRLRGQQRRGAFFLGGSTTVYPFLSLGALSSLLLYKLERGKKHYFWLCLPSFLLVWLGCFFSLSRAPLFLASLFLLFCSWKLFMTGRKDTFQRKYILAILLFSLLLTAPAINSNLSQSVSRKFTKVLNSGISPDESSNTARYYAWYEGSLLFTELDSWLGNGLGTSTLAVKHNKLLARGQYRFHYESAIFSTFSEGGTIGLLIFLSPFILVVYSSRSHPHRDIYLVWMVTLLVNFFAAPIYGYSSQLAYFVGMSFCFVSKPET